MAFAISFYITSFILSLFSPFLGLIAMMCSLLIRFQDRYPDIANYKPFTILLIGLVIGCFINQNKISKIKYEQDKYLLGMLIVSIFGLILMEPGDLISETIHFVASLSIYYFTSRILLKQSQFYILFFFLSLTITYMGYEAIISVLEHPETTPFVAANTGRWQGLGYYANSNEFGQLMVTTIPFLLAIILSRKSFLISLLSILMMSVMVYVIGKTSSRTVMIVLALMVILTFMFRSEGNIIKKGIVGGIFIVLSIVALSYVPGPIQDRLHSVLEAGTDKSFQGRVRAWGYGFDMLSWYPITGVGKGQWNEYHGLAPHNSFVQIMAELGPLGIYLFIMAFVYCFKEMHLYIFPSEKDPPEVEIDMSIKTLVIAVEVTMIGWLVYIFLGNQGYAVWTYFYIGLCAALKNLRPIKPKSDKKFKELLS